MAGIVAKISILIVVLLCSLCAEAVVNPQEQLDALGGLLGKKSPQVPTLVVGRKPIEGFEAGSWNSALDLVGYPKAP
jgi:hypothetical protein